MLIFLWRLSLLCGTQRGLFGELILYLIVFYPPLHHRDPPTMFYMAGWLCFCTSQHSGEIKGLFVVCIKSLLKKKVRTFNECAVNMSSFCGFHFHWAINSRITGISFLKTTTGLLSGSTVWILIWMRMLSEDAQRLNQHSALTSAHFLFWRFFFLLLSVHPRICERVSFADDFERNTDTRMMSAGEHFNVALNCILVFNKISHRPVYSDPR